MPTRTPPSAPVTASRPRRRGGPSRRRRLFGRLVPLLAILFALVVLVGSLFEANPALSVTSRLPTTVEAAGRPVKLDWPGQGEAALATSSGVLLGRSGGIRPVPIASVTKVMTALLVLREHPLANGAPGFKLRVTSSEASSMGRRYAEGQSLIPEQEGEVFTERQALEALLLPSADNIAFDLGAYLAPGTGKFVAEMNAMARRLGMSHTHFTDASGYDRGSVSDATDLLKLARAAMAIPAFSSIVALRSVTIAGTTYDNYNSLVGTDGFTGIKTGSTPEAHQALLFSVSHKVGGRQVTVLGDVLEQQGPGVVGGALAAAKALADSYFAHLAWRTALPAGTLVGQVSRVGQGAYLETRQPLEVLSLPGAKVHISVRFSPQQGDRGEAAAVSATAAGSPARSLTVRARAIRAPGFFWKVEHFL